MKALAFTLAGAAEAARARLDLVDNLLGVGEIFAIFGPEGTGKSTLATFLAGTVARGGEFFGRATISGAVLYIGAEGAGVTARRLAAMAADAGGILPVALVSLAVDLTKEDEAEAVVETMRKVQQRTGQEVRLVIIDGLSDTLPGDENGPIDTGRFVQSLRSIRDATGAAVGFIHHSPQSDATRLRGHTRLAAALDLAINVTGKGRARTATVTKRRDGGTSGAAFTFEIEQVVIELSDATNTITSRIRPLSPDAGFKARGQPSRLPPDAQTALDVLRKLQDATLDRWRDHSLVAFGNRPAHNKRQAWSKSHRVLFDRGLVVRNGDSVSVSGASAERQQHPSADGAEASAQHVSAASPLGGGADGADNRRSANEEGQTSAEAA